MTTLALFNDMLNQYAPNAVFREELIKRDYFLKNCKKDNAWLGGPLIVPFEGAKPSTVKVGSLVPSADIRQAVYVRGQINSQPEAWGSIKFYEKDLVRHGKINEQSLVKLLPGEIESLTGMFKNQLSQAFTNGRSLVAATDDGTALGVLEVARIERLEIGMNLVIESDTQPALAVWVKTIDVNANTGVFTTDSALTTLADLSAYTVADNTKLYVDGNQDAAQAFTSLKLSLLSAANGGSASLYGQSKLAYPYLQAINIDGSSYTTTNILEKTLSAIVEVRNKGKGMPNKVICSYLNMGAILQYLEKQKGAYRMADAPKDDAFGWTEVTIMGPKGSATFVAIQEMDDDYMMILDMDAMTIYSNGFVRKRVGPDGLQFYTERLTDGYQYILDICFYGDLVLERPSRCGIIYNLNLSIG